MKATLFFNFPLFHVKEFYISVRGIVKTVAERSQRRNRMVFEQCKVIGRYPPPCGCFTHHDVGKYPLLSAVNSFNYFIFNMISGLKDA